MKLFLSKRIAGFRTSCAVNLGLLCLLNLLGSAQLQAATGILVRMTGIKGDSTQSGYKDFVEASSFSFGIDHVLQDSSKGGTADLTIGVGELKECEISKVLDRASTQLAQLAANGQSLDTIEVFFISPSSSPESTPPPFSSSN